jgi:hypothetical protein
MWLNGETDEKKHRAIPVEKQVSAMMENLTCLPYESACEGDAEVPSDLPPPQNFERRSSAPAKLLMMHNLIERRHSGAGECLGLKINRPDLISKQMTRSMPNLHCSRTLHNRSMGFSLNAVPVHCRASDTASHVLEFERLIQDI